MLQVVCSGSCAPGCPKPLPAPASPLLGLCSGHAGWPLYGRVFAPFSHLLVMHPSPSTPLMHPPSAAILPVQSASGHLLPHQATAGSDLQ